MRRSADPKTWIEVRLSDFYAPELHQPGGPAAKEAMKSVALGRPAICLVEMGKRGRTTSYDRVIASCRIDGRALAATMRDAGVGEGGNGR